MREFAHSYSTWAIERIHVDSEGFLVLPEKDVIVAQGIDPFHPIYSLAHEQD